ncbi:Coatomer_delta subunit [Hexamita inflata]|uniref:Coatomer delta subunit n=1 Tax=Hexamita inflata TaxID=28002 RepID=A0AA86U831_9EUKA|nr:Coatomer delta subunit [Hexamita inflata]
MSIVASAIFKPDHTVLCARVYAPRSRSSIVSLIDTANKQIQLIQQASGTLQLEEHTIVYQKVQEQLLLVIAEDEANIQEANFLLELLSQSLDCATDPFESLSILDELSAGGQANEFLISNRNVKGRLEMHSETERKFLEERKQKAEQAEIVRKQREAEIAKQQGTDGLLNAGLRFIGFGGKPKQPQGHGIDEAELVRLRMKAQQKQEPEEVEKKVEEEESDEEFRVKKRVEEEVTVVRQRKGRELKSRKVARVE